MTCLHFNRRCINSRRLEESTYRRYKCKECGMRFTTLELNVVTVQGRDSMTDFNNQYGGGLQNEQIKQTINLLESFIHGDSDD